MNFDEKIEHLYLTVEPVYIPSELHAIIKNFPREYFLLLGLRATFIKQELIFEGKLKFSEHRIIECGLCVSMELLEHFNYCSNCPAKTICINRDHLDQGVILREVFNLYMKEHEWITSKP